MPSADQKQGDELSDFLDALVAGQRSPLREFDAATSQAVDRFFESDDAPAPPSDLAGQIWEKMMGLATVAGEISLPQSIVEPTSLNGRVLSRLTSAGSIPKSMPLAPQHAGRRGFAHRAIAALLILILVLGYFAFEPLRSGPDTPQSIPGAVVQVGTPEQEVTSTPFPLTGHTIIGVWRVDYSDNPGSDTKVYSFGEDGKYSNTNNHQLPRVTMGQWRATGERTLELVCIEQMIQLHDLWDPELETVPYLLDTKVQFWRLSITVDETGNSFTGTGGYSFYGPDGTVLFTSEVIQVVGTRMAVVAIGTEDTPGP